MDIRKKRDFPYSYPNDLIEEILLRLPVKSLIRFKSVCNSWHSLISDPRFANLHFDSSLAPPTNKLLCMTRPSSETPLIDVDTTILLRDCPMIRLPIPHRHGFNIKGSCRGFILLGNFRHLTLWNPSTGLHTNFPFPPEIRKPGSLWFGLGYDKSNDDYLVFLGCSKFFELRAKVEIFSVRANSWKEIEGTYLPYAISFGPGAGTFLNGSIHWVARKYGNANGNPNEAILAFDLVGKKFKDISLPHKTGGVFYHLMLLGDCLGICHVEQRKVEIWIMKEYDVNSSWTKLNFVFSNDINYRGKPVCFTRDGKLVATNDRRHLVKVDDRGSEEFHAGHHDVDMMVMFTQTLLSLPGTSTE